MSATIELHMGEMGIQLGQQITLSKQEWKKELWVFCEGGIWAGIRDGCNLDLSIPVFLNINTIDILDQVALYIF